MPSSQFIGPMLETGIQIPHYFNGRLLTAADLKAGQDASNTRQTWFGQSSGYGIVDGLEVSSIESDTKLHIAPGIGMNLQGKVINLNGEISLPPLPAPQPSDQSTSTTGNQPRPGQFASIKPQLAAPVDVQSTGVFLLTVVPTENGYKGAATTQIPAANAVVSSSSNLPGTANQWEVERASLKIIRIAGSDLAELYSQDDLRGITVNDNNRRNLVAHWCYGTLNLQNLGNDPFAFSQQYGDSDPLDTVTDLGESDIPLAAFHWNGSKLTFVDMWSVRRRVIRPDALAGSWQTLASDKRVAINQARFLQFQDHLDDIVQQSQNPQLHLDLSKVKLTDYFTFLPPIGFLPTIAASVLTRINQQPGKGSTGEPGTGTQSGGGSEWWSGLVTEAENIAKAIDPLNWLRSLHIGVNTQATQIQDLQTQLVTLTEQITSMQQKDLVGEVQKQPGEITTTTPSEGAASSEEDSGDQPTRPLSAAQQREQQPPSQPVAEVGESATTSTQRAARTPDQLLIEVISTLLDTQKQSGPGLDLGNSFAGASTHLKLIGSDSLNVLLQQSWYQDAIDLRPAPAASSAKYVKVGERTITLTDLFPKTTNIYLITENLTRAADPVYTVFHGATQPTVLLEAPGGYK